MSDYNVLILGSNGQAGKSFQELYKKNNIDFVAKSHFEIDITNIEQIESILKSKNFTHIVNCAAYNNVDKAETEKELCYSINAIAPLNLSKLCKKYYLKLITFSSDFVFNGEQNYPYTEADKTNPLNYYGKSKSEGESLILNEYNNIFMIRTSWVFGLGNNFINNVINQSKTKTELKIVTDQVSSPTYSNDLAYFSWEIAKTNNFGLYHVSGGESCSKYELAKYVLNKINQKNVILKEALSTEFNSPAKRPKYSKLDNSKVEKVLNIDIPHWQTSVDKYLSDIS